METTKIITTLWAVVIPTTILFLLILFTNWKSEKKKEEEEEKVIKHQIVTLSNIFAFLTFFCWILIGFLTFSKGLVSGLLLATLASLLLTSVLNVITSKDEVEVKPKAPVRKNYIRRINLPELQVTNKTHSYS